jgi:hypothetical protein
MLLIALRDNARLNETRPRLPTVSSVLHGTGQAPVIFPPQRQMQKKAENVSVSRLSVCHYQIAIETIADYTQDWG